MSKRRTDLHRLTILVAVLALFGAAAAQAGKQAICHFPPGNPDNFHTIVVSDNAVDKHVAKHDDLVGSCLENCETICDDGDFCTQDVLADPDQCICLAEPRPAVDCDDSNPCTVDDCSTAAGACVYDSDILNGTACDDGDPGTTGEVCNDGECVAAVGCPCNSDAFPTFQAAVNLTLPLSNCVEDENFCGTVGLPSGFCAGSVAVVVYTGAIDSTEEIGAVNPLIFMGGSSPDRECGGDADGVTSLTSDEGDACLALLDAAVAANGLTCTVFP